MKKVILRKGNGASGWNVILMVNGEVKLIEYFPNFSWAEDRMKYFQRVGNFSAEIQY